MNIEELFESFGKGVDSTPERRVLLAALECIAEKGLEGATVRAIAAKAGLNPASINYYYRSKDRLIYEALNSIWSHVSADIDEILNKDGDIREAVASVAEYLLEGSWRYPRTIRAIIEHPKFKLQAATHFSVLFKSLADRTGSAADSRLGAAIFLSFAVMLSFGTDMVDAMTGLNLSKSEDRRSLAKDLAARLLSPSL